MRDLGITPKPLNLLAYLLDLGTGEEDAVALAALLERQQGGAS
jgi:hypothetical protein